jgi:sigma-B regulation protein RsbU (phosphoserine phosphatase)
LLEVLDLPGMGVYLVNPDDGFPTFDLIGRLRGRSPVTGLTDDSDGAQVQAPRRTEIRYPQQLVLQSVAEVLQAHGEPFWSGGSDLEVADDRQAITREQAELKARAKEQQFLVDNGIELLIPMVTQGRLVGIVGLPGRTGESEYQVHELQLLTIVAGQVALQIENSRLYEEEIAKQLLEEEMVRARQIQSRLLPASLPAIEGCQMDAVNISSKQVSGDYYDLIEREDGKLAIIIADVSGKGMPASILASNIQAALRAQCYTCESPAVVLERINLQIHASTDSQHFATLFLAVFDPSTRELVYSSGGHNAPILIRSGGTLELLEKGGLPLGAFDFGTYEEGKLQLDAGDLLFLYTDGLTETKDATGEDEFGEERLNRLLHQEREMNVSEVFTAVKRELAAFSGRKDADDDITMVGLKIVAAGDVAVAEEGHF